MHSITYNQDLVSPVLLVTLTHYEHTIFLLTILKSRSEPKAFPKRHFLYHQVPNSVTFKILLIEYKVTYNSLDVPSTMYSFMKAARFIHLNLEGMKCILVYNHHRKTAKIENE
ncbi:hypothetical protein GmHk_09G025028 [Glycine max]|nr:hypothetical protein GmHk_09G025028 [Glycine max]